MNNRPSVYFPGDQALNYVYLSNNTTLSSLGPWYNISICTLFYVLSKTSSVLQDVFTSSDIQNSGITILIQVAPNDTLAFSNKIGSNKGLVTIYYYTNILNTAYYGFDFTYGTPFILTLTLSSTSSDITCNLYVNGSQQSTTAITGLSSQYSINMDNVRLSGTVGDYNRVLMGGMSAFGLYNTVLSTTNQQQLEAYMSWKNLGNGNALYSGHSYKSVSPNDMGCIFNPSTPVFVPSWITGLQHYYSAELGVTSSSNLVSGWSDQSGNSYNAIQSTAGLQPTISSTGLNTLPCIVFDGVTSGMMLTSTGTGPSVSNLTVCTVLYGNKKTTGYSNHFLSTTGAWGNGSIHCRLYSTNDTNFVPNVSLYGGNMFCSNAFIAGQPIILIFTFSISSGICTISFYENGGNAQVMTPFSVTQGTITLTSIDIGGWSGDGARTFYGGISSFITYNTVLTTAQRQLIEGHLAWKWFVAGSVANPLPSTHPYYSVKI